MFETSMRAACALDLGQGDNQNRVLIVLSRRPLSYPG
jgi:hypothetical protein